MSAPIYSPGYWNDPYRPHHPPHRPEDWCHPHHRIHSDIEPAFVVRPGEECCPDGQQNCECVTSGDVERWNAVWEMMSAFSGQNIDELASGYSAFGDVAASADLWNETYNTVFENKDTWDLASAVPDLSARMEKAEQDIKDLSASDEALSAELNKKQNKLYFDVWNLKDNPEGSFDGDGSEQDPYRIHGLADMEEMDVVELVKHFKPIAATPQLYDFMHNDWSGWSGYGPYPIKGEEAWISDGVAWWILTNNQRWADADAYDEKQQGQIEWNTSAIHELYKKLTGTQTDVGNLNDKVNKNTRDIRSLDNELEDTNERIDETNERITDLQPAIASGVSAYAGVQALLQKDYVEFKFAGDRSIPACSGDGIIWVKED